VTEPARADLLDVAFSAAAAAAELLASHHGRPRVVQTKSSPTDVVTEMDRAAEQLIRGRILAERPGDAILGEEGGLLGEEGGLLDGAKGGQADGESGRDAGVRWIVDPLDGTVNYLYGLPDWAVSIAAEMAGTVVAGVVCVPRRDSLFSAVPGGGAWLRSMTGTAPPRRLTCNEGVPLGRALVATGFGYSADRRRVQGQVISAVLPRVRDIRRGGSCAVDLCSLAGGQVDGYFERGVQYWDIAAGALIAREAGARVDGLRGRPAGPSMTVAGHPALFGELHDLLVSLDPERDE
jgi:myo-inositol-1(or 4)-monophosphatase